MILKFCVTFFFILGSRLVKKYTQSIVLKIVSPYFEAASLCADLGKF